MPIPTATPITVKPLTPQGDSMRGIAYMAGGMFLFSAVDTQAKFLTESLHPIQIVWSRQLGLFLGVLILIALRGVSVLHTKQPLLQVGRGVLAASEHMRERG